MNAPGSTSSLGVAAVPPVARRGGWAHFCVCAGVLAAAAGFMTLAKQRSWLRVLKLAAPLQRSFETLQPPGGYTFRLEPRLSDEIESELGTADYAVWTVDEQSGDGVEFNGRTQLFLTYYTGKPDQVPHVPEECYAQGGRTQCFDEIMELRAGDQTYPVRRQAFKDSGRAQGAVVYYMFAVNGDYLVTRDQVRRRMLNLTERYLYYSKVELSFIVPRAEAPPFEKLDAAAGRVFDWLVPLLAKDYWPDVKAMEAKARQG